MLDIIQEELQTSIRRIRGVGLETREDTEAEEGDVTRIGLRGFARLDGSMSQVRGSRITKRHEMQSEIALLQASP